MKLTIQQKEAIEGLLSEFHIGDGIDNCAGYDNAAMEKSIRDLVTYIEHIK